LPRKKPENLCSATRRAKESERVKIGIAGYGKMGRDIFSIFFDKLPDTEFVILDTYGKEENAAAVAKTLAKSLKRKKITEEQYEQKMKAYRFTDEAADMSGCDLVIEAIFEDIRAKKSLFCQLAGIVGSECMLLTNTSSLDIAEIFADVPNKERCFGMHFFYPVKLTGFVELNVLPETSPELISRAAEIIRTIGKKPLVFSGEYHIYLNQILSCMVSHAIYLRETTGASVEELRSALSELYPVADVFEILDSVGLGLMAGKPDCFRIERNRQLLEYGCTQMNRWLDEGCPKETLSFLDFIAERETPTGAPCGNAPLSMISLILCETVNALSDEPGCDAELFMEAVQDILGLAEALPYYYGKFGAENIFAELERLGKASGFASYKHADKAVWDRYFG